VSAGHCKTEVRREACVQECSDTAPLGARMFIHRPVTAWIALFGSLQIFKKSAFIQKNKIELCGILSIHLAVPVVLVKLDI
jgi:hypothetical protein